MRLALLAALLATTGCTVSSAVGTGYTLPRERALECREHRQSLDMRLAAVVLVMNSAGCVCEPPTAGAPLSGAAAAAAGGTTIAEIRRRQGRQPPQPPVQMPAAR